MAAKTAKVAKKTDLIDAMMKETGWDKAQCKEAIDGIYAAKAALLKKNDRLTITGVGTYNKVVKKAVKGGKKAINPFTKEEYITSDKPASVAVKFRPGKAWMEQL